MRGTIIEHKPRTGKKTFGYSLFLGRDENGKQMRQVRRGFEFKRDAEAALRAAIEGHVNPAQPDTPQPDETFASFFDFWMASYKAKCAPKTRERYLDLSKYALRHIGHLPLRQVGVAEIDDMLMALENHGGQKTKAYPDGKPLASKTVREIAFLVAGCFKTAVARKRIPESPFAGECQIPEREYKEAVSLDENGLRILLSAAAGTRLYPLLVLACATGCRRGELLALTWADIDFRTGVVQISKSLEETRNGLRIKCTKGGKPRAIPLPAQALDSLQSWRAEQERDRELYGRDYARLNLVFCRPDGEYYRPDKVSVRVTELARKAGLHGIGLHSLRHSHASHLLSQGTPIPTVAKRLGHKNANVTLSIYSHALPADEAAAADVWSNSLGKVISESRPGRRLSLVITDKAKKAVND